MMNIQIFAILIQEYTKQRRKTRNTIDFSLPYPFLVPADEVRLTKTNLLILLMSRPARRTIGTWMEKSELVGSWNVRTDLPG